jgi:nicotinate-nucleotide pyrophosphorylase (carboxylating)
MKEGDTFQPVKHVATVRGKARLLLLGERVALNLLARCSGIATKSVEWRNPLAPVHCPLSRSRQFKDAAQSYGFKGLIAGTRKTTPGMYLRNFGPYTPSSGLHCS